MIQIRTWDLDQVVQIQDTSSPEPELQLSSLVSFTRLVKMNHHQNNKQGHDLKEKTSLSTNMTSNSSNSKYIKRYIELKNEVHDLSCFDLASKQLNLLAYIGRTSDNSRINGIEQQFKRIEEFKISANYLQWRSEHDGSWSELCLGLLQLLAGKEWKGLEAMDS